MKKIISGLILTTVIFTACQKKTTPVDGSNATVTLINAGANFVTDNVTVNPKDSIFFSFNISSNMDMKYVSIQKNPVNQTAFLVRDTLTAANKNSYTAVKKFMADSTNGDWVYRIVAHDQVGNYIGHKDILVSVKADFNYFTYRFLQVPDTTAKTNTCYMAASTGTLYSYTTGAAKSADIDFGFYYDTATANKFSVYALSAAQPQLAFYDISTWTKNATIMKKAVYPSSGITSFTSVTSAGAIRNVANTTNMTTGTSSKISALVAGFGVVFKTVAGKTGIMNVNYVNGSSAAKDSYINVDVKIEK